MKKCNLLVTLILTLALMLVGCGGKSDPNPFAGTWKGTLDYTEFIKEEIAAGDPTVGQYLNFEDLTLVLLFEFTEEDLSLSVDDASKQEFVTKVETALVSMVDAMMADMAAQNDMTVEDLYNGMETTRDEYVDILISEMNMSAMIDEMAEALELGGTYKYDEEKITLYYEDDTYEEMKYAFEGETLTITVTDGETSFDIVCEKAK